MAAPNEDYFRREYFERHPGKVRYLDYLCQLLRTRGVASGRVLDVGSGLGFLLEALDAAGYTASGLELSPIAAARARERTGAVIEVGDADQPFPFPEASFAAVMLHDVIEHLHRVPDALAEIHRVLEPGGKIFVVTLNAGSAARPLLGRRWSFWLDPTHVTLFSKRSLTRALRDARFRTVRVTTISNFCSVGEGNARLKPLRRIGRVIETPWFGDSLLAVAEK
jgi:SAM-dependent methyltransferase